MTDATTSPERQREQIQGYASVYGHTVIHTTEDLDMSGAVSPFERPELGPWLTEPDKINAWDSIIVAKLDRLTRSLRDFDDLRDWCDRHGKTIISVGEKIDLSTSLGRMFANLLAMFAEFERERQGERRREAAIRIAEQGNWGGGLIPFGKRAERSGNGWRLVLDDEYAAIVRRMAKDIIGGHSLRDIARWLNAEGVPTSNDLSRMRYGGEPKNAAWAPASVKSILRSDGLTEPPAVLDYSAWNDVQKALDRAKGNRTSGPRPTRMLLRIAYCGVCRGVLHGFSNQSGVFYICENKRTVTGNRCPSRLIPASELEKAFDDAVVEAYGLVKHKEPVRTRGRSYKTQISKAERDLRALDQDDPEYDAKHAALRAERSRLQDLQKRNAEQATAGWQEDGRLVRDVWPTLDKAAKRSYALERHWRFYARRDDDGLVLVTAGGGDYHGDIQALSVIGAPQGRERRRTPRRTGAISAREVAGEAE